MATIQHTHAREILDSRGEPTVEVTLSLEKSVAVSAVPSGASTGSHEALELRDNDQARYKGKGVLKAVAHVNESIAEAVAGKSLDQRQLDDLLIALDGSEHKSNLGANALLGVSMAFARASALEQDIPLYEYLGNLADHTKPALPQPMFNIINGGKHADSGLDIQEFMLAPIAFESFAEKVRVGSEVIHTLKELLHERGFTVSVGDEGGFAPKLPSNEDALKVMVEAIQKSGYTTDQVKIGMDSAASSFYSDGSYTLRINGKEERLDSASLIGWYRTLVSEFPIMLIEDGLAEDDWSGFSSCVEALGDRVTIVGDDLLVTNIKRIQTAIETKAVNSVLIKPNQIGTVSETIDAISLTKKQGWKPFASHRSGETTDTFIADLAVGLACPLIKAGALVRGERVCKYNRLMEIESQL